MQTDWSDIKLSESKSYKYHNSGYKLNNKNLDLNFVDNKTRNLKLTSMEKYSTLTKNCKNNKFINQKELNLSDNNKNSNRFTLNHRNLCPRGENCANYQIILELDFKIQKLQNIINNLNQLNEYFVPVSTQENLYKEFLKNNRFKKSIRIKKNNENLNNKNYLSLKKLSIDYNKFEKPINLVYKKNSTISPNKTDIQIFSYNKKKNILRNNNDINNNLNLNMNQKLLIDNSNLIPHKNIINNKKSNNNIANVNFNIKNENETINLYENLLEQSQKNKKNKFQQTSGISFLSFSAQKLNEISESDTIKEIINLTSSDELFIKIMRTQSNKYLINLCDILSNFSKDFVQIIKLIMRIKGFLKSDIELVQSILNQDSIKVLLNNTCKILDCDRASLFIYDELSDKLIVQSAEGLKQNQIRVPKDAGIVGEVFMTGQKLKIDDAYQDPRFNRDVDKKTGYRTRTILCYPLINQEGEIFGVIQAINKKGKIFNADDEQIMYIFSKQASNILTNIKNMETSSLQISRLKNIFYYNLSLLNVNNDKKFTRKIEELCDKLFINTNSRMLFLNENGYLVHIPENKIFDNQKLGIIYYVMKNKNVHGCRKVADCKYYNMLYDIPANECLVTIPVFSEKKCIGVLQTKLNMELSLKTELPKENERIILELICESIVKWYNINKDKMFIN